MENDSDGNEKNNASRFLFSIIKDGNLVDNSFYQSDDGKFKYFNSSITLCTRGKRNKIKCFNDDQAVWNFLVNDVYHNINDKLKNKDNNSVILFNDKEYENNTDFFIRLLGSDARNFSLTTGNLIGFIKKGDYSIKIGSRFGNEFLTYMIAYADGFLEMTNNGGENHKDDYYPWLLAYLWNIKLKKAYRLGLPKSYITINEYTSKVRGKIDVVDYIGNISGKYLCSYREHSYDNPALSLFIKAYENLKEYNFLGSRNIYHSFLIANNGTKRTFREIINTPYFTNPFYSDYNDLIDLSKKILKNKGSNFGSDSNSSAFLFDVSMLFEYFIRKLINRCGILMRRKYNHIHTIPAGCIYDNYKRKLEPDIVFEYENNLYVFDVKYKMFNKKYGVNREDLFQLHTYIGQYGNKNLIGGCGFIFPISVKNDKTYDIISDVIIQQGKNIPFHVIFLKVPCDKSNFNTLMSKSCDQFINVIKSTVLKKEEKQK